jgi:enterochelin esterase-like enzyme
VKRGSCLALVCLAALLLAACGVVPGVGPRAPTATPVPRNPIVGPPPPRPTPPLPPRPIQQPSEQAPKPEAGENAGQAAATPTPQSSAVPVAAAEPILGTIQDDRLPSPIIGQELPYRVYLPPDYESNPSRRYPTLYMLHGAGGNYTEWSDSFLPERLDQMIRGGEIPPLILILPDDTGDGPTYWANWSNGGPQWADYIIQDVVGAIDKRYRTIPSGGSRAIGGLSMGGLGALHIAMRRPDVFGVVGAHSPSIRVERDPTLWFLAGDNWNEHDPIWLAQNAPGIDRLHIWLDAGDADIWLDNISVLHRALLTRGVQHDWHVFPGEHEAEYWIQHVPDYLRFYAGALESRAPAATVEPTPAPDDTENADDDSS